MADSKSTDSKADAAKADAAKAGDAKPGAAPSGAVKPPVLDLTARPVGPGAAKPEPGKTTTESPAAFSASSSASKPDAKPMPAAGTSGFAAAADKAKSGDKPADKPTSSSRPAPPPVSSNPGFGFGAAIVGGLLGLGAAYGLASAGLWPAPPAETVAADPRLATYGRAIPELETVTQTTQAELATLTQRVGRLEQAPAPEASSAAPAEAAPDLSADLAALGARIDALAQAPVPEVDTGAIEALRSDFAALGDRIDELGARLGTAESGLRILDSSVSQTSAALAAQPSDIGAVLQLPLILSGLETAFASGRPYETELAALRSAVPAAEIPTLIANRADSGLVRPDMITQRFDEVLPAILAGRPADPDAPWQAGALDWFAGAIALRPTGEMAGDGPEAIASRLIGAVERRGFAAALTLLDSLPAPMQTAAEDVPGMLGEQAAAERFLQSLREAALSGEVAR